MSKLGRKPRSIPRLSRHLYIREDIAATVDLILLDPMRLKVKYGKWSDLVEDLLRKWVEEQRGQEDTAVGRPVDIYKVRLAKNILEGAAALGPEDTLKLQQALRLLTEALP